ncbi:NAC domain-containing protein 89 [Zea mays]|uniref:NAC domain-containing protein 89 n=1 Tax=Zea mays TaxID=4577 RepID=A0A1D6MQ67_MAIZE|nr:NAC domain-containing protein 89 [Zea mays]ONM31161.1 NAC domain-containing protein 89 [Zea mays]
MLLPQSSVQKNRTMQLHQLAVLNYLMMLLRQLSLLQLSLLIQQLQMVQELLDPSPPFNLVADTGSADVCPTEQYAESSNLQNPGSMAPNIRPGHASPIQDGTDATDYLFTDDLPEDLYSMLYPGTDQFNDSIFLEQTGQEGNNNQTNYMMGIGSYVLPNNFENETPNAELQLDHENNKMDMSNENNDTGITIRRRRATAPPANISLAAGKIKMQVGIKRMVTSNSESINQTMKFTDNSGRRLDLRTDVEHQKKNANNVISAKQSDAANHEAHSNQGYLEGFKRCSSAGFRAYIFVALFVVGVAALVLHYHRSNANL